MRPSPSRSRRIKKLKRLAVIANGIQIACALAILLFVIFSQSFNLPESAEIALVAIAACIVIWGAIVDIRDASIMQRIDQQNLMLEEAYAQLENLNTTLRRQRHDFKNHLQVVYTLTEMEAYGEVQQYVEHIYEDVQSVGSLIRTAVPAVNALLSAKEADCREKNIRFDVEILSPWDDMPVPGWELCRIIGNLVDNAMDALLEKQAESPTISVRISSGLPGWTLIVENNGPEIPLEYRKSILLPGFTTKDFGHGNGLSIVRELLEKYGGELQFSSETDCTRFTCTIPRRKPEEVHS